MKVTSVHDDRHLVRMSVNDRTTSCRQLVTLCSTVTVVLMSTRQFIDVCCTVNCFQGLLYTRSPSRQTIYGCVFNGFLNTEPRGLIGNKLSFLTNPVLIWGTMRTAF
ncbi:uncharacterized protein TNCV_302691 [Trichonephila clavipes]|nr:uncharacterized protein TNCV_302691 [Trichonephila clavipes]